MHKSLFKSNIQNFKDLSSSLFGHTYIYIYIYIYIERERERNACSVEDREVFSL